MGPYDRRRSSGPNQFSRRRRGCNNHLPRPHYVPGSGWRRPRIADPLYLHVGDQEHLQDEQAVRRVFASYRFAFGQFIHGRFPHPILRFHVRFWNFPANALLWRDGLPPERYDTCASAHVEPFLGIHDPISFERGEKYVARELRHAGYTIRFDDVPLGNQLQDPPNNGFATRVWKVRP